MKIRSFWHKILDLVFQVLRTHQLNGESHLSIGFEAGSLLLSRSGERKKNYDMKFQSSYSVQKSSFYIFKLKDNF